MPTLQKTPILLYKENKGLFHKKARRYGMAIFILNLTIFALLNLAFPGTARHFNAHLAHGWNTYFPILFLFAGMMAYLALLVLASDDLEDLEECYDRESGPVTRRLNIGAYMVGLSLSISAYCLFRIFMITFHSNIHFYLTSKEIINTGALLGFAVLIIVVPIALTRITRK